MTEAEILTNAKVVVAALMGDPHPLPLISACAVAGNAWQENLIRPMTLGVKDHGSDGMLQWRLSRLDALKKLPDWNTLPVQAGFFKTECREQYPALWDQLVTPGTRTLENLTANICDVYERPSLAGRVLDKRIGYAKRVMALYKAPPVAEKESKMDPLKVIAIVEALVPVIEKIIQKLPELEKDIAAIKAELAGSGDVAQKITDITNKINSLGA